MLIFDRFRSRKTAEQFAKQVSEKFNRRTWVCDSEEEAFSIDPNPFQLDATIVLVERPNAVNQIVVDDGVVVPPNETQEERTARLSAQIEAAAKQLLENLLEPPNADERAEEDIENLASQFGGVFVGT